MNKGFFPHVIIKALHMKRTVSYRVKYLGVTLIMLNPGKIKLLFHHHNSISHEIISEEADCDLEVLWTHNFCLIVR